MAVSRRTVTVLFTDVADSTPLGERLDPESLRRVMSSFFEQMSTVLERHGGTVEKFIGDAIMAVFGIPELHEDDALRAVRAATELRLALSQLNEELERDLEVRIGIRVGINTGEVVAGDGSGDQMLATGDAVNVAKRLEESARTGEILLGEPTRRLVENAVVLEPREDLTLKGKSDPHAAWNVLAVIEGASAYARRLDAPLIGRQDELQQLRAAYDAAVEASACRLFTVLGPAGIGKSRLTAEVCARLKDEATVLTGHCVPYGDGITFWPLVEMIGALGSDEGVRELMGDAEDAELVATRVLGAVGGNPAAPGGETFWAVRRLFEQLGLSRPLVVLVEDIHWAEPTLLDLLEYLAGWIHGAPVLLLCLARPDLLDARPGWLTQTGGGVILEPLTEEQSRLLLDEIPQEWPLDVAAREHIMEAAEGNPLYLEQMAAMLAEGGPTHAIPPTIHALLAARLDRLPSEERAVLESAAVAGRHFVRSALRKLLGDTDESVVDTSLLSLARKDLLTARPGREDAYRFRHALIRDAAYAGIAKGLRAQLHERYADWAANTRAGKAGDVDEIVGYHLEQAVRYRQQLGPLDADGFALAQRAAEILGAAGRRAFARDDAPAAVNLLDRAVALATDEQPARMDLSRELGLALWSLGEVARAEALLNGIVAAAAAVGDSREEWYALLERSAMRSMVDPSHNEDALEIAQKAIDVFTELGDEFGLARSWRALGMEHRRRGHLGESEKACERALEHAVRAGDRREESRSADQLCTALLYGPAEATAALARCEAMLVRAGGNLLFEANVLASAAGLHGMLGEFDEGRAAAQRAENIYVDLGLRLAIAGLTQIAGPIELLAGDPHAAETVIRRGYEILHEIGSTGDSDALLAEALYVQGRHDEAAALVDEALERTHDSDVAPRVQLLGLRGKLGGGSIDDARAAIELASTTDALNLQAEAYANLAEMLGQLGRIEDSAAASATAVKLYTRKGNRAAVARLQPLKV
jgi:class 3 adenylate cyclase/tetratricopeptide (TPR) repeat protein